MSSLRILLATIALFSLTSLEAQQYGDEVHSLLTKAEKNDAEAQYSLGIAFAQGSIVSADQEQATYWFRRAALLGHLEAQASYGHRIKSLFCTDKVDKAESLKWIKTAAERGHAGAQESLGDIYAYEKDMVSTDMKLAVYWWGKASRQGQYFATMSLARTLKEGNGVDKNPEAAANLYRMLAARGLADAQYEFAECYLSGVGVAKDEIFAAYWFRKASEQNDERAQYRLGVCLAEGIGVPKNEVEAYAWLNIASVDNTKARNYRDTLESRLSSDSRILGQELTIKIRASLKGVIDPNSRLMEIIRASKPR